MWEACVACVGDADLCTPHPNTFCRRPIVSAAANSRGFYAFHNNIVEIKVLKRGIARSITRKRNISSNDEQTLQKYTWNLNT
ncbi:hypothetical protein E2C01_036644 [Portunus trituberculatus]|uniref:Uncharacterized protein n=1 Tax=Portunus trituberculatus TaxID=210409 RepID=A0A5B7FCM5_PORTR|nr:hypothetical protein [Portunus trituberculatus]